MALDYPLLTGNPIGILDYAHKIQKEMSNQQFLEMVFPKLGKIDNVSTLLEVIKTYVGKEYVVDHGDTWQWHVDIPNQHEIVVLYNKTFFCYVHTTVYQEWLLNHYDYSEWSYLQFDGIRDLDGVYKVTIKTKDVFFYQRTFKHADYQK